MQGLNFQIENFQLDIRIHYLILLVLRLNGNPRLALLADDVHTVGCVPSEVDTGSSVVTFDLKKVLFCFQLNG